MLLDDEKVITGSFNFSKNAIKNNNENLLIIHSKKLNQTYQKRFKDIWKKYPNQTTFEKYILLRNRKKTNLSYKQYLIHLEKENQKKMPKEGEAFKGKIVRVNAANEVIVQLFEGGELGSKSIHFALSGLAVPQKGILAYNQEPQFTLTREMVILMAAQEEVKGLVVKIRNGNYHGILRIENDDKTLNQRILEEGLAWLREDDKQIVLQLSPLTWKKMTRAFEGAKRDKKTLWGSYGLKESPETFQNNLEKILISMALKEKQYSEPSYERNYLIGNRKTKRVYLPYSSHYFIALKDLTDDKLIFFSNRENALLAGYEIALDQ